jgi:hypothetical protein
MSGYILSPIAQKDLIAIRDYYLEEAGYRIGFSHERQERVIQDKTLRKLGPFCSGACGVPDRLQARLKPAANRNHREGHAQQAIHRRHGPLPPRMASPPPSPKPPPRPPRNLGVLARSDAGGHVNDDESSEYGPSHELRRRRYRQRVLLC